jgi:hypothetical protein
LAPEPPTLEPLDQQAITARLAGAGSMRADIEHVLAAVGSGATPDDYRRAILDENAARKGTGTSRMWAWKRLKLRYALDRPEMVEGSKERRIARLRPSHVTTRFLPSSRANWPGSPSRHPLSVSRDLRTRTSQGASTV